MGFARRSGAEEDLRAGGVDLGEQGRRVVGPVGQQQHPRPQQGEEPAGEVGFVAVPGDTDGTTDHRAEQTTGAGLDQTQQPRGRVTGEGESVVDPPEPGPVPVTVRDLDRAQAVEGDRAQPRVADPGSARLAQRAGDDLEQHLQRGRSEPAPQVAQRLLRHPRRRRHARRVGRDRPVAAGQPGQAGAQLVPDPQVADAREQGQGEHEVHARPRREQPQALLGRAGPGQDVVDEFERQVAGQLTEMGRGEHPGTDGDLAGQHQGGRRRDRLREQRDLWSWAGTIVKGLTALPGVPSPIPVFAVAARRKISDRPLLCAHPIVGPRRPLTGNWARSRHAAPDDFLDRDVHTLTPRH